MAVAIRLLAYVMLIFSAAALLSAFFAWSDIYDDNAFVWALFAALLSFFAIAFIFATGTKSRQSERKQALTCCAFLAGIVPVLAAMPFFLNGYGSASSWFEAVSGLTTSGSSAMVRPSLLPDALIVWRLFIEWIGGWLFLVFAMVLQPLLNIAGMAFAVNYLPHGEATTFYARTLRSAFILARLYAALTGLAVLFFMLIGFPTRIALPLSMLGLSTGGYLPIEQGISGYGSGLARYGIVLVLVLACFNFTLHYVAIRGRLSIYWRDTETKALWRLFLLGGLALFAVSVLSGALSTDLLSISDITFMTVSAISTTGLSPLGTNTAPLSVGILLMCLCVAGGMAGSTTGGIKTLRALLIDRFVNAELVKVSNPHRINPVAFEGRVIHISDMMGVWALVLVIATTIAIGSLLLSALRMPFLTAIAVSVSAVTNTGPLPELIDFRFAGYGALSPAMLSTCGALMLLGKMEFLVLLSFFFTRLLKH